MIRGAAIIASLIILITPHGLLAQSVRSVSVEYDYLMPETVSISEAKRIAIERAKIKAIEDEFGSVVYQDNRTMVQNESGNVSTKFLSLGGSDVKGEWLEDITPPTTEMIEQGGALVIRAKVKGRVREIVQAKIDIVAKILRNGTTAADESESFIAGNYMNLLFSSPQNGYLTVYLLGEDGDAYCLLPYQRSPDGVFRVEKDREYILFHASSADEATRSYVDEYNLTSAKAVEINYIYIIFSPNRFSKASDTGGGELIPRSLTFDQFQEWLTKNRKVDNEMQVISRSIEIRK
ncbi:MAG: DUF4384 domain-containing protein [Rikenellaceae bacterium]